MTLTTTNANGLTAKWIERGATLTELHIPDREGQAADVVLGFDNLAGYESEANQHFGCTTGRFANRIRDAKFQLDGVEYQLARNIDPHHLHGGGERSLDRLLWQAEPIDGGVRFSYTSPDGEENYPGAMEIVVTYTLNDEDALRIDYEATTDKPTIINLTNHSYFNLSGHGSTSILDHELRIDADRYTPVDDLLVPTGEVADLANTPLDFRRRHRIGDAIDSLLNTPAGGYDHNYVLNGKAGTLRPIAELYDPQSGRVMCVETDQPAVQLYTGNCLEGQTGKGGKAYPPHSAVCLETQHYPDSPNQPDFPSTVLRPGETYRHTCIYRFSVE